MGKEEIYLEFIRWTYNKKDDLSKTIVMHFVWLMVPLDGVPRWVSLLSKFLEMEETREKFGLIDCPECHNTDYQCGYCKGRGKIRAEWAR